MLSRAVNIFFCLLEVLSLDCMEGNTQLIVSIGPTINSTCPNHMGVVNFFLCLLEPVKLYTMQRNVGLTLQLDRPSFLHQLNLLRPHGCIMSDNILCNLAFRISSWSGQFSSFAS